jgi:hypothetical protein
MNKEKISLNFGEKKISHSKQNSIRASIKPGLSNLEVIDERSINNVLLILNFLLHIDKRGKHLYTSKRDK